VDANGRLKTDVLVTVDTAIKQFLDYCDSTAAWKRKHWVHMMIAHPRRIV
jgi:hypothetical protein